MGHTGWDSPRWRSYSRTMRKMHPWCSVRAKGCLHRESLQVHHTKYPPKPLPLWIVAPWNLVVACRSCHSKITQQHRGKRNPDRYLLATIAIMGSARFAVWRFWARLFWGIALGAPTMFVLWFVWMASRA